MDTVALGYKEIVTQVHQRSGIRLTASPDRTDHLSLQSRLETGDWLWITEYAANITPLARRVTLEAAGVTLGWHIAIFPTNPVDPARPDHFTWLASVTHESALAHQLPDLVENALRALPRHEQHHIDRDGNHHVSAGITDWSLDVRIPPHRAAAHHHRSNPPAHRTLLRGLAPVFATPHFQARNTTCLARLPEP
ncbi:hypothetical protein JNN96_30475 [Mycobacterium sp. DSM 3803]|nr:hypothetical protein [Mycobacterium sp. DSM 3803]